MTQSTCAKCKRFISRKRSYFCGADNGLYPSDDCDPVVAAERLSLLDRLELILETFNARMVEFNATAIQGC
ncbi:hypothetical protein ALC56_00637 [Trachymyrmex septentrionalis]|uniref:Uncharacterized protein n=1 Tax=Trachymyrmex septentrionalis TaxID=34720 RepID=A0A195FWE2_9HYME|nr:hypothetical protein ALC56_00637 [Trachymyrmex septentrionalis]